MQFQGCFAFDQQSPVQRNARFARRHRVIAVADINSAGHALRCICDDNLMMHTPAKIEMLAFE